MLAAVGRLLRGLSQVLVVGLAAAASPAVALDARDLPAWKSDSLSEWRIAWLRSCARQPWQSSHPQIDSGTAQAWQHVCTIWPPSDEAGLRRWIERHFKARPIEAPALVTGYFEPEIEGRAQPEGTFTSPLYRPPLDPEGQQVKGRRGWTRAEIEAGALSGQGLEIAWTDPVDAFFLHIQGSGVLTLPGREPLRVAYAANNGHPYYAIGQYLVSIGAVKPAGLSMQSLASWLRAHPGTARAVMNRNARFIFFQPVRGPGPTGATGAVLTAGRSLAVDPAYIPYGIPVWLDTAAHDGGDAALRRLTVAQDTGYAIKGPARADYFWGTGAAAGEKAGRMKAHGRLYMLLPHVRTANK